MRDMRKKYARLTVELSIMIAILVVVLFSVLGMFGNGLKTVVANSGFTTSAINQKVVENKTGWNTLANTQENVAITGVQGIQFNPKKPEEWINATFATLLNKDLADLSDIDLEALARALAMAERTNMKNFDEFAEKCENLGINNNPFLSSVSFKNKKGNTKTLNYKDIDWDYQASSNSNKKEIICNYIYTYKFQ